MGWCNQMIFLYVWVYGVVIISLSIPYRLGAVFPIQLVTLLWPLFLPAFVLGKLIRFP